MDRQQDIAHPPRHLREEVQTSESASERKRTSPSRRSRSVIAVGVAVLALLFVAAAAGVLMRGPAGKKEAVTPQASPSPARGFSNLDVLLPAPLPATARAVHIPILAYHLVDSAPPPPFRGRRALGLTVTIKSFDRQMAMLRAKGYHTVTPYQVYQAMAGLAPLPLRALAITFDDGYRDNYTNVFPVLRRYGFTATFFVITGKVGHRGYMNWAELREMTAAGMLIESHTVTHPVLTRIPLVDVERELVQSKLALRRNLGIDSRVLCYPYGAYDPSVMGAARAAGYIMAFTTKPGLAMQPQGIFALPRVAVGHHESLADFMRPFGS